jgi:hypothetical protein
VVQVQVRVHVYTHTCLIAVPWRRTQILYIVAHLSPEEQVINDFDKQVFTYTYLYTHIHE